MGSSPLARGGPTLRPNTCPRPGLIPARAGRTKPSISGAVHPGGSSPLARGGLLGPEPALGKERLIPARAGRTATATQPTSSPWAHPRSRGADRKSVRAPRPGRGSSPLARGGHRASATCSPSSGLIPARAGRTSRTCVRRRSRGAHPRSRGADGERQSNGRPTTGSSPLARGGRLLTCTNLVACDPF